MLPKNLVDPVRRSVRCVSAGEKQVPGLARDDSGAMGRWRVVGGWQLA